MFGNAILVAPKLENEDSQRAFFSNNTEGATYVKYYLPPETNWYYFYTKTMEPTSFSMQGKAFGRLEYGIFVKAGSILPMKMHF